MEKIQSISPNLLSDTLSLVELAQQAARQRGSQKQAERLSPVVEQLQTLVKKEAPAAAEPSGILAQDDFRTLLEVTQKKPGSQTTPAASKSVSGMEERNQMVGALAAGGMEELQIARQLGMTRDEVRLVMNLQQIGITSKR